MIRTADHRWLPTSSATSLERMVAELWPFVKQQGMPTETAPGPTLTPHVNHGRWVVDCPGCPASSLASSTDLRFFCCACGNTLDAGRWLPVSFPPDADQVERALAVRRHRRNRNWGPPETVADLLVENAAHGLVG